MSTRKKAIPEMEAKALEPAAPVRTRQGSKKPAGESVIEASPAAPERKKQTVRVKRPAATHKPPARKAMAAAAAAGGSGSRPTFDPSAHHEEIAHEAYVLWQNRGARDGQEHDDWYAALEIVRARHERVP